MNSEVRRQFQVQKEGGRPVASVSLLSCCDGWVDSWWAAGSLSSRVGHRGEATEARGGE